MFSVIGVIPILSFNIKAYIIPVLLILAVIYACMGRQVFLKINCRRLFVFSTVFILYLISLIYTSNLQEGLSSISSRLPLIFLPITFFILSSTEGYQTNNAEHKNYWINTFTLFSSILGILILIKSFPFFSNGKFEVNLIVATIEKNFFWLSDHPIYITLILGLAAILGVYQLTRTSNLRIFYFAALSILVFAIIILARKGVMLATTLGCIIILLKTTKSKLKTLGNLILVGIAVIGFMYLFSADSLKRINEVFDKKVYAETLNQSSTSMRFQIYKCGIILIGERPVFGYGIGDVKETLRSCYKENAPELLLENYNSHNQYIGIALTAGLVGLAIFISINFWLITQFIGNKNFLGLSILSFFLVCMLFENILERQNGAILYSLFICLLLFSNNKTFNKEQQ